MPIKRKRPIMPLKTLSNNTSIQYLTSKEESFIKYMNHRDIMIMYEKIESESKLKIKSLTIKIMTDKDVSNSLDSSSKFFFNIYYKDNPYKLDREIVIIKEIFYEDGTTTQYENPIYFFKSTGESRGVNTKNIWFPTGRIPFEIDIVREKIGRITKLEDKILLDQSYDSKFNIKKYGRFLTLENALISKYLYDTDM